VWGCGPFHLAHNSDKWRVCVKNVMKHSVQCSGGEFSLAPYLSLVTQLVRNVGGKKPLKCNFIHRSQSMYSVRSFHVITGSIKKNVKSHFSSKCAFLTTVKAESFARTSSFMRHTKTLLPTVSFSRLFLVVAKP